MNKLGFAALAAVASLSAPGCTREVHLDTVEGCEEYFDHRVVKPLSELQSEVEDGDCSNLGVVNKAVTQANFFFHSQCDRVLEKAGLDSHSSFQTTVNLYRQSIEAHLFFDNSCGDKTANIEILKSTTKEGGQLESYDGTCAE